MKVGLCCCYDNKNYGSMLQSLATKVAIGDLGCECEIIRYEKNLSFAQKVRQVPRVLNSGNIKARQRRAKNLKLASKYPEIQKQRDFRNFVFERFCKSTFTDLSDKCIGFDSLCSGSSNYDAVVVGSDQLWLPAGLPTNFYNLQFVKSGIRRVSYATSFGVSKIPWYQKSRTADYLRKIDSLSVREDSGAAICREVAGVNAEVVVDPTLLHDRNRWAEVIPDKRVVPGPYIFCYFLGSNPFCRSEAQKVSDATGLPIVTLRHLDEIVPSDEQFGDMSPYDISPADFVNLIRSAEYVLTDSFHGTVFSIIHHKRFATFYRFAQGSKGSRNSRIDSLFAHLDLANHLAVSEGEAKAILDASLDFEAVDARLSKWRDDSWTFLKVALD